MKPKTRKRTLLAALALAVGLGCLASGIVGNPLSLWLASRTAQRHLSAHYADTDFYLDRVSYNFKGGNYEAEIRAPGSVDRYFTLHLEADGTLWWDDYEDRVTSGRNTERRLNAEYCALVDAVLEDPAFPYGTGELAVGYGTLEFYTPDMADDPSRCDFALEQAALVPDGVYDILALGAQAGRVRLGVTDSTVTYARAAELLLELKRRLDAAGVPFYAVNFTLEHSAVLGNDKRNDIDLDNFLAADIYEEGLTERVRTAYQTACKEGIVAWVEESGTQAAERQLKLQCRGRAL